MAEDTSPQNASLHEEMKCSIISNPQGDIIIFHDREIRSDIQWIEFNPDEDQLYLVHEDGMPQSLGISLNPQMRSNLTHGLEVSLVLMVDEKPVSEQVVTIVVQNY